MSLAAFEDDDPTLVHSRGVSELRAALAAPIPPPLPHSLKRVQRELAPDDLWLASLPAATRAILDQARRGEVPVGRVAEPV